MTKDYPCLFQLKAPNYTQQFFSHVGKLCYMLTENLGTRNCIWSLRAY